MEAGAKRPHILAIPFPLPGHMTPVVQLCSLLMARMGCSATMVCNERAVASLRRLIPEQHREAVRVLAISDGLPLDMGPFSWDVMRKMVGHAYHEGLRRSFEQHMHEVSDVACVISDVYLSWTQEIADGLGIPRLGVWISTTAEYQVNFYAKELIKKGILPFKEPPGQKREIDNMVLGTPGRLPLYHKVDDVREGDEEINLPALPSLHRRDFPSFLQIEDSSDELFYSFIDHMKTGLQASMVIFNTFELVDGALLDAMRAQGIHACCIGPLFLLEEQVISKEVLTTEKEHANAHEVENDDKYQECIQWLDKQKPRSVIYVAFGSMLRTTKLQATEIASALLSTKQPFIWVFSSFEAEEGDTKFLRDLFSPLEGQGFVLKWARQKHMLEHPSMGVFLSHCGWNSILESVCRGVPMLCLPHVGDQFLNCKMVVDEWKVGLRLERSSKQDIALAKDISCLMKDLLSGSKGSQIRENAQEWKRSAEIATQPGGPSWIMLDAIIKLIQQS